ncbi:Starch-binding associating with outer membrane [Cnuella takakiae]|uniref:Starch-binding associating with outer membrane n=1 Tax=Cnuella takakiae TaxID=1302690 RepID=A0A1M5CLB4_9BACT|nr:SusD/RagB family nutrient-binding outer membrane lipoprotein [Cnuella takakiae]OLY91864.1 carbohydrate-binding protein SusD [Cnuella takakiae]SHF55387.1 Starch-binding associating with outer membrane [Cnuella takakiae]
MKLLPIGTVLLAATLLGTACTKNFEERNTDPNRPKEITPGVMLGQLQYRIVNSSISAARNFTHELMQVDAPRASTSGAGLHRYVVEPGAGVWTSFYNLLTDIEEINTIAKELNEPNYRAIALIYKAWAYSILTDLHGDIPFSDAIKASEGVLQPKFDSQKDIYMQLLQGLDTANAIMTTNKALTYGGDQVYNANAIIGGVNTGMVKWKRFCNSLKLRLLLRTSKRDGELNVREQINQILANPTAYPLFAANSDEAIFRYPGTFPYFNPYFNARQVDWRDGNYFTQFFLNNLNSWNDPRRGVWATTINVGGVPTYRGIESGYATSREYTVGSNSSYNDALKTLPQLGVMMTYAEVEFMKAELALKGYPTGATPRQHYEAAIAASMLQWGVAMPATYLEQPGVAYDATASAEAQLEQIMLQKYYAYFFVDFQAWFEKRRTGYPILPRGSGIPVENKFPNRIPYPSYLQSLNAANLAAAVSAIGGDRSDVKVWWAQ